MLVGERRREVRFTAWSFEVPEELRQLSTRMVIVTEEGGRRYEMAEFAMGRRPLLSICGDQGGSGLASWLYMATGKKMRVIPQYDRFHRVNRDWRDACNDSGLWAIVLEVPVVVGFPHGPWGTESWRKTLVEAGESYMETTGPEDLHFLDTDLFVCLRW